MSAESECVWALQFACSFEEVDECVAFYEAMAALEAEYGPFAIPITITFGR